MRVPAIFWWPGHIKPAVVSDIGSTLDLLPTLSKLAGVPLPDNRIYDGYDLSPVVTGEADSPRKEMFYYHGTRIFAARKGDYKLYFYKNNPMGYPGEMEKLESYRLFNLQHDPSERFNLADKYPEVVKEIEEMVQNHKSKVVPVKSQLEKRMKQ
jgi:arylsulfatase A-like enzyme